MEERILGLFKQVNYKPMRIREISQVLNTSKEERIELEEILRRLTKDGKIARTNRGRYALPETLDLIPGTYQGHPKGFGFLIPDDPELEDYFIPGEKGNGVIHKDRIFAEITKKEEEGKRAEAEVVEIIERGPAQIVGTYEESKNFGFVVPDDKKYSSDIFIPKKMSKGAVTGHKVLAEITNWSEDRKNPDGKIVSIIGHINDPGVDILSIIYQFDLPTEFPEEVLKEVEAIAETVSKEDKKGREDLRAIPMVTIDGEDAKDLDDAISLEILDNGNYRLGVHIADVTHYVEDASAVDKEALERGTSVYLVDRVIPMLPHKLSNGICSLNAGVDRLTLSCIMDIDKDGKVVGHRISETLINIDERMSYTDVKEILEGSNEEKIKRYADFVETFKEMDKLSALLKKKREKRGAIDFDFKEGKVIVDKEGKPLDIVLEESNRATEIIESFMLAANEAVAEDYYWQDKPFLFRTHNEPDPEKIENLSSFIYNFGYSIKGDKTKIHPKNFQKILKDIKGSPQENVISRLVLRSMKQARYTAECEGHFGLAATYYSHFTSPIRRYPDLQIHRIIKCNLNNKLHGKVESRFKAIMPEVAKHSSIRERIAEEADRETVNLKKIEYMSRFIGKIYKGIITGITSWGVYVELFNTVEGLVHVSNMDDDYYIHDEKNHRFVGERTKKTYRLGDSVHVRLTETNMNDRTIDFVFVEEDQAIKEAKEDGYELK